MKKNLAIYDDNLKFLKFNRITQINKIKNLLLDIKNQI